MTSSYEDEFLNQILGNDGKECSSSGQQSITDVVSSIQRVSSSASYSTVQEVASLEGRGKIRRSHSVDGLNHAYSEMGSNSPNDLRQRALDEKKRYKILKGEGKSEEALKAFKRGKELERQADALEMSIRKNRRKVLPSGNSVEIQNKDGSKESGRKSKLLAQVGKEKDDLTAELRELGWSDMDPHDEAKKSVNMSLEGELSSLLGDISRITNKDMGTSGIDKTQVLAHKRKALTLKREGKLAEAKEELKKAKVLEKQLEEQDLLGVAEESDDEISALIHGMDNDNQDELLVGYEQKHDFDFDHLMGMADDLGVDGNFEVTDEDLVDPEIAATLKSLGWTDDTDNPENIVALAVPVDREALQNEILSLKREALNQKRAGNVAEAMAQLKKAKLLERDLEGLGVGVDNLIVNKPTIVQKGLPSPNINAKNLDSKIAPKSRLTIQKELLTLKKKALALRREGRLDEAEEELKKGKVLEQQLEEMDNASKLKATQVTVGDNDPDLTYEHPDISGSPPIGGEGKEDVTDQDMQDPTYLSLLRNLGWKDDNNELANSLFKPPKANDGHSMQITEALVTQATSNIPARTSRRSKAEIQRELLGLKRKALTLRREGKTDDAEEVLMKAKTLEAEMAEIEAPKKEGQVESNSSKDEIIRPHLKNAAEEGDVDDVTQKDMHDPALLSMLKNIGWKDEELEAATSQGKPSKQVSVSSVHSNDSSVIQSSSSISAATPRSKGEIQRELLSLKRRALALRRKGETEEAEELLKMAEVLEVQMEELEEPKKELLPDVSEEKKSGSFESWINHEKQRNVENVMQMNKTLTPVAVGLNEKIVESFIGSGRSESTTTASLSSSDSLIPGTSQVNEGNRPLLGELDPLGEMLFVDTAGTNQGTVSTPSHQSVNIMDLLTGDDWRSSQISAEKPEDKVILTYDPSFLLEPLVQEGSLNRFPENLSSTEGKINFGSDVSHLSEPHVPPKDITTRKREEVVIADGKPYKNEMNSAQGLASLNSQDSLRQEVLARKRKAVALKREGKLTEAREELRQAKLLEKSLGEENPERETGTHVVSTSVSKSTPVQQKEPGESNLAPKPLSGRDRFKLQQESLSHKRQALKLRREGRKEEAEAEFELAKTLEAQLEELSQDSTKSSVHVAEPVDDVVVEDLLDPQLLSALKAIGIEDANVVLQGPERPVPVKANPGKSENISQERIQLEERIKAEKVKAVNLKRSGKQAEALDALRRAKLFEKKLHSLASN